MFVGRFVRTTNNTGSCRVRYLVYLHRDVSPPIVVRNIQMNVCAINQEPTDVLPCCCFYIDMSKTACRIDIMLVLAASA